MQYPYSLSAYPTKSRHTVRWYGSFIIYFFAFDHNLIRNLTAHIMAVLFEYHRNEYLN